jgi:hypothetical protein
VEGDASVKFVGSSMVRKLLASQHHRFQDCALGVIVKNRSNYLVKRWPPGLTSLLQNRCRRLRRPSILSSIVDACLEATWDLPLTETRWFASLSPHHQELACYVEIMFLCAVLLGNPRTCRLVFCLPSTRPFQLEWSPEASQIDVKLASVVSLPLHKNFT